MKEEPQTESNDDGRSKMRQELDTPGKLMVTGIPKRENYEEAELEKEFAPYGRITEVNIIRDKRTSIPRGFAFITYENPQDSEDAIKAMEGKDLGGESAVHCEQAVIGLRKSKMLSDDGRGWRGGGGFDRGYGRGMVRGRGRGFDRGRAMFSRGMRGGMPRGRGRFDDGMGRMYPEEEYYEEYYEPEPAYGEFPPRGGYGGPQPNRGHGGPQPGGYGGPHATRGHGGPQPGGYGGPPTGSYGGPQARGRGGPYGGPPARGHPPGRGGPVGQDFPVRGGRRVLLPDPPARGGGPYPGPPRGPTQEEYYGEEANNYSGRDYYSGQGESYAEGYEEPYTEDGQYPIEGYYDIERPARPRGGGAGVAVGRGVSSRGEPEARPPPRYQAEDYGYPAEGGAQRSRAPAPVQRSGPSYNEEMYDEEPTRVATADSYGRGRGRPLPPPVVPAASPARHGRVAPVGRGGAAPARRAGLLEPDPYTQEDPGMYLRAAPQQTAVKVAAPAVSDYDEDPYGDPYRRRISPAVARQPVPNRSRAALLPSDDVYASDNRVQHKPSLLGGDNVPTRRSAIGGAPTGYGDDYRNMEPVAAQSRPLLPQSRPMTAPSRPLAPQSRPLIAQPRDAYAESRRPVARRHEPDYRMREDSFQRPATETDAYVAYPASSRPPATSVSSDPYSRKRAADPYADAPEVSGHAASSNRREYDEYRPAAAVPAKRERIDRGGDRGGYDNYSSRQEGSYRGL